MSKRLIYAEDAIDSLKQLQKSISGDYTELDPLVMAGCGYIGDCIGELECLPSAQPQRMKGRWIRYPKICKVECDQCGKRFRTDFTPRNFCPSCGADMRGEQDG